eukprot:474007-Prymnesium_polylepis.1
MIRVRSESVASSSSLVIDGLTNTEWLSNPQHVEAALNVINTFISRFYKHLARATADTLKSRWIPWLRRLRTAKLVCPSLTPPEFTTDIQGIPSQHGDS